MFRLVKYRYAFLIISLLIIIPGTISLIARGLDLGIDFAGGSIIELQPQAKVSSNAQIEQWLKPQIQPDKLVYIRLNTQIDVNVQSAIQKALQDKYSGVNVKFTDTPVNGSTLTLVTVTGFKTTPSLDEVKSTLGNLPKTSDPAKGAPSSVAATPTAQATTAATTPTAQTTKVGATPTTQATAAANATPVVVTTPTSSNESNPAITPVTVADIKQGTTTQAVTIQTRSSVQTRDIPKIQGLILAGNGPYTIINSNSKLDLRWRVRRQGTPSSRSWPLRA